MSDTIKKAIIDLLKKKPNPSDTEIHQLAEQLGVEHEKVEEIAYKMLADRILNPDRLPGGLADNRPDSDFDPKELKMGIKVEREHVGEGNDELAKEITKDHLAEIPDYYTRLLKMEKEAEGKVVKAKLVRARPTDFEYERKQAKIYEGEAEAEVDDAAKRVAKLIKGKIKPIKIRDNELYTMAPWRDFEGEHDHEKVIVGTYKGIGVSVVILGYTVYGGYKEAVKMTVGVYEGNPESDNVIDYDSGETEAKDVEYVVKSILKDMG